MAKELKNELRYDRGSIEIDESADGFLRARVVIAKPGVFPYLTPSGEIRYEAKLPEDLFSEATISSAKGVPVTDDHPSIDDSDGMVNTSNWKKHVKGSLGDTITVENEMVEATETIFDADLISELKAGNKLEVSIGFKTSIDYTPGEFEGEKYDAKQTNIIINHIAHVDSGRAGEDVRAYLDSADSLYAVQIEKKKQKIKTRRDSMDFMEIVKKFLASIGVKFDSDDDTKKDNDPDQDDDTKKDNDPDQDDDTKKDNDPDQDDDTKKDDDDDDDDEEKKTDSKDVKKLKKSLRKAKARRDAAEALVKKLSENKKRQDEASAIDRAVEKRLSLINAASSVIQDFKHDGLSDREIMLKVIEKTLPFESGTRTDKLDNVYVKARFDAAMAYTKEKANIYVGAGSSTRIDAAAIEKKKFKRLTMMEEDK